MSIEDNRLMDRARSKRRLNEIPRR